MGRRIEHGDVTGGESPFPAPAGIGLRAMQAGIGRHPRRFDRLIGDRIQGIDADRVEQGLQAHVLFQQR
ncbi:hypothetical protein D3C85_1600950 [compost metagenome]